MKFSFPVPTPDKLSPLTLAYVGDAVYELYVRCQLLAKGFVKVKDLHHKAINLVNAGTQADLLKFIEPQLTDEEKNMVRRGRNAKSGDYPKKATVIDYRYSTGLECLIGYLYLMGELERIEEILGSLEEIVDKPKE
ncbi:Mini-ribonuclease 3 [Calderihabitans maritimus]|uniref:Mini-ribonuclease 3 n=1 Tax=Calderihabitans maritimus TaxID=1246530 RepID=A0A1Z5HNN7_9FIRM|nr:ribonuclease III domain-containing protein [Calderihabitans maritimus]GAW91133.1 ribonuclease III [Calderihabitans maritimus]